MTVVDVHAHWFPRALTDMAERLVDADLARTTRARAAGADLSVEEMTAELDAAGIDVQVLSPANLLPAVEDEADSRVAARETNDLYTDLARRAPGRFAAFGVVPLPHVDAALAEADRCLGDPAVVGIALGCSIAGRTLDDRSFEPFWRELDRRGATVFLHPTGDSGPGLRDYHLDWVVGAPFEDTLAALRLVLSGVTTRYPAIHFVVPHLGGTIPFLLTRIDRASGRIARSPDVAITEPASAALRRLHYDTSNRDPHALRCAAATLGPDRLLLGTDFPYSLGAELRENLTYVGETLADPHATTEILGATASRLLGL